MDVENINVDAGHEKNIKEINFSNLKKSLNSRLKIKTSTEYVQKTAEVKAEIRNAERSKAEQDGKASELNTKDDEEII